MLSMVIKYWRMSTGVLYVCHVEQVIRKYDPMVIIEVKKWKTVYG